MDSDREKLMIRFITYSFIIPLFVTAIVFFSACTVAGKKSDDGTSAAKSERDLSAVYKESRKTQEPQGIIFSPQISLRTRDGVIPVLPPWPAIPVMDNKVEVKDVDRGVKEETKSKESSSWSIKEVSGFYWILLGIGILIIVIAIGVLASVWIVFRMWQKSQGTGMITFLKDQLVGLVPGTETAKAVDTIKSWVRSKYNLR
jgi:hypothetical protein